ncbi:MAG: SpoIID/LytB domain-containing protein [Pegethrix bostrychoides GSE-TBD4-15B]|uniref:SpoIID/LytB domain-containing protein n=1 Tax=Pegethrix bostrychoides GSE-TBD4-15B TaxID=2839662 RepID=A0A951PCI2_9CYAN|nr:SpoIID/LytB domain-containing protein [Pegethrix bostrychoides GSE-TBD4-15B]
MLKTRFKSAAQPVAQLFKQYPWLLLSLLAGLQLAGVLLISRFSAPDAASNAAMVNNAAATGATTAAISAPQAVSPPAASAQTGAKSATKSATKSLPAKSSPSSAASSAGPAQVAPAQSAPAAPKLTAEQQRLNEQYKQSFANAASSVDSLIEMRVAIAEGVPTATISGASELIVMTQDRQPLNSMAAGVSYTVQPSANGITLNGSELPAAVLIEPANDATFNLGERTYRGNLMLVNDGGKLWAVNLVNLRSYLHSVVASEVSPSWPQEALKAQSVAARSYALTYYFKPMSSLFHLGATEYYQVYSGIGREAAATSQAVDATAGEFVSYRGGIVESLYAASDDIVAEAFHGHGMSQLGALSLAEQGYGYQQILGGYYPGTGLGKFVSDQQ